MATGPEHYREAEKCLDRARGVDFDHAAFLHREAQAHAMLALFDQLQEIGDQLDTLPRKSGIVTDDDVMRCAHGAVVCGLCGYGVPAGDGGRS